MRQLLASLAFFLFALQARCQNGFTTVSGAIVDPNGIPWAGGTISAQLITQGGTTPTLNGQPFTSTTASGLLGPGGTFTMRLGDNGVIVPGTTTWQFTVSISPGVLPPAGKGPQSFTVTTAINCGTNTPATCTANAMTITAALAPVPALSFVAGGGAPAAPASSLQYNNAGTLGGSNFFYSSGPKISNFNPNSSTFIGAPIFQMVDSGTGLNSAQLSVDTGIGAGTTGTQVFLQTNVTGTIQESFPLIALGYLGGTLTSSCTLAFPSNASCAVGVFGVGGTIPGDTNNGQQLVGVEGDVQLNRTVSQNIGSGAAFFAESPNKCYGCGGVGAVTETAQNLYGLYVADQGGHTTVDQAGIKIASQTTPGSGTKFGIEIAPGGGKILTEPATTTEAGLNLPHGTAPTSPVNGDLWTTTAGAFVQVNGATVGPLGSGALAQVSSLPATCSPGTTAPVQLTTNPVGIYYCDATNHFTNAGLSGAATIRLTDFGVLADTKMESTGTWSNGVNPYTVTITAADIPFTSSDTGHSCVGGAGKTVGTFTFVSATSGTCNVLSTTSAAGNGNFVVGTDNSAAALSAWNTLLAFPRCGTLLLPNGVWWNANPLVNSTVTCAAGPAPSESGGITVRPANGSSYTSMMFQPPNFNFGNCLTVAVPACMFASGGASGNNGQLNLEDFAITGAHLLVGSTTCGNGNNYELGGAVNVRIRNVSLVYGFTDCSNNFGDLFLGAGAQTSTIYGFSQFDAFGSGGPAIFEGAPNVTIQDLFVGDLSTGTTALQIGAGGSVMSISNQFYGGGSGTGVQFSANGTIQSYGDTIWGGTSLCIDMGSNAAAKIFIHDEYNLCASTTSTFGITFRAVGQIATFQNVTMGAQTNSSFTSSGAGTGVVIDYGGNSFPTTSNSFNGPWKVIGPPIIVAGGTGVCTASQTLFLFPAGEITARTCTATTESLLTGQGVITQTGTLHNLRCTSTAGGVNASSGVVTARQNGANSTITATFGTGTTAIDTTHNVSVNQGDVITFQVTTQAAETLAGIACQVQVN
jgi:hypothetical protein